MSNARPTFTLPMSGAGIYCTPPCLLCTDEYIDGFGEIRRYGAFRPLEGFLQALAGPLPTDTAPATSLSVRDPLPLISLPGP